MFENFSKLAPSGGSSVRLSSSAARVIILMLFLASCFQAKWIAVRLPVLIFSFLTISCYTQKAPDVIYVIPDNYRGNICILFNQSNGTNQEYSGTRRVYRIPANGLLKTQFQSNHGDYVIATYCYSSQFIFEKVTNSLTYINTLTPNIAQRISDNDIICFENVPISQDTTIGELFSVSSIKRADSVAALRDDFMINSFNK